MITFRQKGNFSKVTWYLERAKEAARVGILDKYGKAGVAALEAATPVDTGETAQSWKYRVERGHGSVSLAFYNTNVNKGIPIVILLQYGHATSNGGYVEGVDFINPALKPIFDKIADEAWKEVVKV